MSEIESTLLAIESEGEAAGWNSHLAMPMVFEVRDTAGGELITFFPAELNEHLHTLCGHFGGDAGCAVLHLAEAAELTRVLWEKAGLPLPHEDLVGIGLRSEMWSMELDNDEEEPAGHVKDDPRGIEGRFVQFFARDGRGWHVQRLRGSEPQVIDLTTEKITGGIPHGLTRIVNALVSEDVPLRPIQSGE